MPRKSTPRIVRASGIETSGNGMYFYWKCNVSGKETFAPEDRFNDVVKKYGSEEKLFKNYVLRPVQKYVDAGWDADAIKAIMNANEGDLPRLEGKTKPTHAPKGKRGRKPNKTTLALKVVTESGVVVESSVYPWTNNPDYFKSTHVPVSIEELTKNACAYPNRNLNDRCFGCSVYDVCQSTAKYSLEDMKKKTSSSKITKLESFNV